MARVASVKVTAEILCQVLCFPEGTEVLGVAFEQSRNCFQLIVSSPSLPETNGSVPVVWPQWTTRLIHEPVFAGWGPAEPQTAPPCYVPVVQVERKATGEEA